MSRTVIINPDRLYSRLEAQEITGYAPVYFRLFIFPKLDTVTKPGHDKRYKYVTGETLIKHMTHELTV